MDITPLIPEGRQIVERYGGGGFQISGVRHVGSVLVFPQRTLAWDVASFDQVTTDSLAPLIEASQAVELLLLGTGPRMQFVAPALRETLKAVGVTVDGMDTGAACRTYNVLMAEERLVAAALIATD